MASSAQRNGVWKSGRGKGRARPKGRELDDAAAAEVRALLGDRPRRADLLIEHLHLIQDAYGRLSAPHLHALAEETRLAQAEVYEVATFYAHFDVVKEGGAPPPPVTIRVCDSLSCELAGAQRLKAALEASVDSGAVRVLRAPCMGRCDTAPAVEIGHRHVDHATPERVADVMAEGHLGPVMPDYEALETYRAGGGYTALAALRAGARTVEALRDDLLESGLRGLGGAGFPSGRKFEIVRNAEAPKYLAVNGDEGEPGTFKDRFYLERTPHLMLEGALIAAHGVGADRVYLYMRDEYPAAIEILRREIAALEAAGLAEPGFIELRRGAGAYICGEESAMIESHRGQARPSPSQTALRRSGRPLRPADAGAQHRDIALDRAHCPRGTSSAVRPRQERAQGFAELLGVRPGG